MVEIRRLTPTIKLRMPTDPQREVARQRHLTLKTARNKGRRLVIVRRLIDFPSPTPQPTPCRLWQGPVDRYGYGRKRVQRRDGKWEPVTMHRWTMTQVMGRPLRQTEVVLHLCDNRLCYRVDHLKIGTVKENNADMVAKRRNSRPPVNGFKGEDHPSARLTEDDVREIRRLWATGEHSQHALAKQFGVKNAAIFKIVHRQRWSHIE